MGAFNINITGVGGHGCERKAKPGEKLYGRCGKFSCPDCAAYDFMQRLRQAGMLSDTGIAYSREVQPGAEMDEALQWMADHPSGTVGAPRFFKTDDGRMLEQVPHSALFTHWPTSKDQVVDDMLKNERKSGQF